MMRTSKYRIRAFLKLLSFGVLFTIFLMAITEIYEIRTRVIVSSEKSSQQRFEYLLNDERTKQVQDIIRGGAKIPPSHLPGKIRLSILEHEATIPSIQQERLDNVRIFCENHPEFRIPLNTHLKTFGHYYSVLSDYRIIECRVAKTGTTFRSKILWSAFHGGKPNFGKYVHPDVDPGVQKLDQLPSELASLTLKYYGAYLFVREPIIRFISSYFSKLIDSKSTPKFLWALGWYRTTVPTLGQYFHHLATHKMTNEHFMGYFDQCNPCLINYTFIGRQETQVQDFESIILEETSLWKSLVDLPTPQVYNPISGKFTIATPGVFDDVDQKDIQTLIQQSYAEYDAFGYNPDDIISYITHRQLTDSKQAE